MRQITIPGYVDIDNTDYEVEIQFYQDDVISAIYDRIGPTPGITIDFTERQQPGYTIDQCKNWIHNQLVTVDPFVFTDKFYYIGKTVDSNCMKKVFQGFNIEAIKLADSGTQPTQIRFFNGDTASTRNATPQIITSTGGDVCNLDSYGGTVLNGAAGLGFKDINATPSIQIRKIFFPTSSFSGGMFKDTESNFYVLNINMTMVYDTITTSSTVYVKTCTMYMSELTSSYFKTFSVYGDLLNIPFTDLDAEAQGFSGDDPYLINPSTIGGGYGTGAIQPSDLIEDPEAPDIDAISTGLLTIFKPSLSQVQALGDYLWSSAFDVNTLKKLFGDPMEAIIGLSIVPINPPGAGSKNVKIGDVDTGISMPYITRQFIEKDLGSLTIDPYIGSFMDYAPYTKISIYLPYIGFRQLAPEDVMGCTLNIKYIIDVLTGGCNAVINVSGKGAIYQFNGSCIANVPLSAINYSGAIQNAVSAIGNLATVGAGIATGQAPITGMGLVGLATQAANTAVNSKPHVQHSGNMGGAAGLCSVQYAYAVIERPRLSTPANYNGFIGNTLNVTMNVGDCSGLTVVESIHLDNVLCTENERDELLGLLHEGVIIHVPEPEPEPEPEPTPNT